jgi:hypothetical protein
MGNGGEGIVFTTDAVYWSKFWDKPLRVPYAAMDSFEIEYNKKRNPYDSKLIFNLKTGRYIVCEEIGLHKEMLADLCAQIREIMRG